MAILMPFADRKGVHQGKILWGVFSVSLEFQKSVLWGRIGAEKEGEKHYPEPRSLSFPTPALGSLLRLWRGHWKYLFSNTREHISSVCADRVWMPFYLLFSFFSLILLF